VSRNVGEGALTEFQSRTVRGCSYYRRQTTGDRRRHVNCIELKVSRTL